MILRETTDASDCDLRQNTDWKIDLFLKKAGFRAKISIGHGV